MIETILYTLVTLSLLGALAAMVLFFVARRFRVFEDPRIDLIESELPAANCGGCGYAGCRNFAETISRASDLDNLFCPVGGNETMSRIAGIMGFVTAQQDPRVAVLRCNGNFSARPRINQYDGPSSCAISAALYAGETGCPFGCLGLGDCVAVCKFNALQMDEATGLPVVNDELCTSCGACVKACPRNLFELRKRWKGQKKIFIACMNEEKGGIARKSCQVACIGCAKCVKVCPYDAITMANNLAYIDPLTCRLCRKCVTECPTNAILEIGFPQRVLTTHQSENQ